MMGAITGDIIGSVYEALPIKNTSFPLFSENSRFTDDTVLTVAIASAILASSDYSDSLRYFGRRYPNAGYGSSFFRWMFSPDHNPYGSWGNGSAMRVSPVGLAFDSIEAVMTEAERSAAVTHNHPEGIKGAQATALAIFLARKGEDKHAIKREIESRFGYDLKRSLEDIRPLYTFDVSCQGSVPESIIAFLESDDIETSIKNAVSLGGDSDTMACIAGGIAEAYYGRIPREMENKVRQKLPDEFIEIIDAFYEAFNIY